MVSHSVQFDVYTDIVRCGVLCSVFNCLEWSVMTESACVVQYVLRVMYVVVYNVEWCFVPIVVYCHLLVRTVM